MSGGAGGQKVVSAAHMTVTYSGDVRSVSYLIVDHASQGSSISPLASVNAPWKYPPASIRRKSFFSSFLSDDEPCGRAAFSPIRTRPPILPMPTLSNCRERRSLISVSVMPNRTSSRVARMTWRVIWRAARLDSACATTRCHFFWATTHFVCTPQPVELLGRLALSDGPDLRRAKGSFSVAGKQRRATGDTTHLGRTETDCPPLLLLKKSPRSPIMPTLSSSSIYILSPAILGKAA